MMHERGKSDGPVVPGKPPNNAQGGAAEAVEGRGPAKGNATGETRPGLSAGQGVSSELDRVRRVARRDKDVRFTALLHHVDVDRLRAAYFALRPKAAPGVDGVTWGDYGLDLEANLRDLHARVHGGAYRAKPSRRVYIPKPDGRLRPLGVAALEDKILQRAVVEVLNAIYEQDFLGFSYGFRPGRSPHHALDALAAGIKRKKVNWVLDADFRDYFSSLDHRWLERFLEHRIADQRVLRLIQKWLAAGVIEDGSWTASRRAFRKGLRFRRCWRTSTCTTSSTCGSTSGGRGTRAATWSSCGSPTTPWWASSIGRTPSGSWPSFATGSRSSAWSCNAEKTRLIEFGRFAARDRQARGLGKPETFASWASRTSARRPGSGRFKLRRVTDSKRLRAKLRRSRPSCATRMHQPIPEQGRWLASVLRGHYQLLRRARQHRGARAPSANGHPALATGRFGAAASAPADLGADAAPRDRWLPQPRILHPWPDAALRRQNPRQEPSAVVPHAGICAGGGRQRPSLPRPVR